MLRAALGAAAATMAAGALLESQAGAARADGTEGPTTFTGSGPSAAVTVDATNGADGVVISSVNTSPTPGAPNGTGLTVDVGNSNGAYGIKVQADPASIGLVVQGASFGISVDGSNYGIFADCSGGRAVAGFSNNIAIYGEGQFGVYGHGRGTTGIGLHADSDNANAIEAVVTKAGQAAVLANGGAGTGVVAHSDGGTALRVEGPLQVAGSAVGQVVSQAGATTMVVSTPAATVNSLVLLTPLENPRAFLWISARAAASFTISASRPLPGNLAIQYLVIN
jgi:hypothetical protein